MTPQSLRAWAVVIMRDILSPGIGLGLTVYLIARNELVIWHGPILLSLVGVPFVGRGDPSTEPDSRSVEQPPEAPPELIK